MVYPVMIPTACPAFDLAKAHYAKYPDLNFADDLLDYMRTGFVVSRPKCFAMFKAVKHGEGFAWYIRYAIGDLIELLMCMPCYLPKLVFCRNNKADQMRVVSTDRLAKLAALRAKRITAHAVFTEGQSNEDIKN